MPTFDPDYKERMQMGDISVDLTGIQSEKPEIPQGEHRVYIYDVQEAKLPKDDGTAKDRSPYIPVELRIADGPYNGLQIFDNISLAPRSLWKLKQLLESLSIDCRGKVNTNLQAFTGRIVKVTTFNEKWQGVNRPKVARYSKDPLGGTATVPGLDLPPNQDKPNPTQTKNDMASLFNPPTTK